MRSLIIILALALVAVNAAPSSSGSQRIVGGSITNIATYPFMASVLSSYDLVWYYQYCGGTILNNWAVLTAARCLAYQVPNRYRVRVGSTYANSGGVVHNAAQLIIHPQYNYLTLDSDIAIVRTNTMIVQNNNVRPGSIAGTNYNLADNQIVWALGWGAEWYNGPHSEVLRHVQIWAVNQVTCRTRYAELGRNLTDNMLCAGWLDVGGRDQCQGDDGGPLLHNGIVVGVSSWGQQCALARYPGVNTRVSRFTTWIQANA